MSDTCPPCNHNCNQGRDCPARKKTMPAPTDLAETILRDVPRYTCLSAYGPPDQFMEEADVLAALSTALEGVDERAGEIVSELREVAAVFTKDTVFTDAADLITALLTQNAALRAERDALADELHTVKTGGILEVANKNNRVTEYMFHWEGRALDAEARVERLEAALKWYSDDPSSQGDVARAALKGDDHE